MDSWEKVDLLGEAAQHDICLGHGVGNASSRDELARWIYPAARADGRSVRLLKVLQSNYCQKDCGYCVNRSGRDLPRTSFSTDELALLFSRLARQGLADGLFLSSGVWGPVDRAMGKMLDTVDIIRRRYHFQGYVHLKILPGADDACIEAALKMADRVSVNLEAPSPQRITALSGTKDFRRDLLAPLQRAHVLRRQLGRKVSLATQFVAGGAGESDRELLSTSSRLYDRVGLARIYYSAFRPVPDTPLENHPSTPAWREHRLYQADFLLRKYAFTFEEIVFDDQGNLSCSHDPKLLWAVRHPEYFPLEVNSASRGSLLRVPGIGPVSADRILRRRREAKLTEMGHLGLSTATVRRAAPYLLLGGKRPIFQLSIWPTVETVAA